jgi:hypothetical protein
MEQRPPWAWVAERIRHRQYTAAMCYFVFLWSEGVRYQGAHHTIGVCINQSDVVSLPLVGRYSLVAEAVV